VKMWSSTMVKIWNNSKIGWWWRARTKEEKEPNSSMVERSHGWVAWGMEESNATYSWWFIVKIRDLNFQMMRMCSLSKIKVVALLQRSGLPSLVSFCNNRKIFILLGGGGVCLGFYFLRVLGVGFFFWMAPSLCSSSIQDTFCLHYSGLYTLGNLSRHVKSAHLHLNLVS
jgi:hypothetical protein